MDRIDPSVYERADEGLRKLLEKANVSGLSEKEYDLYEASMKKLEDEIDMEEHGYKRGLEAGLEKGMAAGKAEGLTEGVTKGKVEAYLQIITNLRKAGFSDEKIAEITKIPLEEVKRLR